MFLASAQELPELQTTKISARVLEAQARAQRHAGQAGATTITTSRLAVIGDLGMRIELPYAFAGKDKDLPAAHLRLRTSKAYPSHL